MSLKSGKRVVALLAVGVLSACADSNVPSGPNDIGPFGQASVANLPPQAQRAQWFKNVAPEVLELDQTVYADDDEATGQLVFGVEHAGVGNRVRGVLARRGVPASAYRIEVTAPVRFAQSLQQHFEAKIGGIQIHFGNYLCTLGFNARSEGGERSFITNSHCTNKQGGTEGTQYYQPVSSVDNTVIATEVDDPAYSGDFSGCSRGKVCRLSDAARAAYASGVSSTGGAIARTASANSGSLESVGVFTIRSKNDEVNTFTLGTTLNKVGRTTGWSAGEVSNSCATVNVFQTKVQLHCQTFVHRAGATVVGSGDSGSPVFRISGGTDVELVGILWGSSGSNTFLFSPLASIKADLGAFEVVGNAVGGSDGPGGPGDDPDPPCVPRGKGNNCR
jgi:hypothetical protein